MQGSKHIVGVHGSNVPGIHVEGGHGGSSDSMSSSSDTNSNSKLSKVCKSPDSS